MPFAYYERLSASRKRVYRASDRIPSIEIPRATQLADRVDELREALAREDRRRLVAACRQLVDGLNRRLGTPPVTIRVLAARPSHDWGELHGLYEPNDPGRPARITVWMRTARRAEVVAFRTFLRTLLHELGHHLDYELLELAESFHTHGFFRRESSLLRQLLAACDQEA